jgi:hypothetical protein
MMDGKQWVQHISGQGEKWEVEGRYTDAAWKVHAKDKTVTLAHYLPKSEYRLCDPTEQWEAVTGEDYRIRKVQLLQFLPLKLAFIVERRKS